MNNLNNYLLRNNNGMQVELLDFGARVRSISLPINGTLIPMTLAYEDINDYRHDRYYLGATVGRVCNRIANAKFTLGERDYRLSKNSGEHCLHGGKIGFSNRFWRINHATLRQNYAEFTLHSADGDQGFPGSLTATVSYRLTDENRLIIEFGGLANRDTLVNLCNHCYFHLGEPSCDTLLLQLRADHYLPTDDTGIPTGAIAQVHDSDFSFVIPALIGQRLAKTNDRQLLNNKGFDHCYLLEKNQPSVTKASTPVAKLTALTTGVTMSISTDQPAMQLYTGQYLAGKFSPYQAICLEAQQVPNDINQHENSPTLLPANTVYRQQLSYQFAVP